MKRLFHPSVNAWQDVPDSDVEAWSKAGWRTTKPKHVDDSGALPVGEFHVPGVATEPAADAAPTVEAPTKK